MGVLVVLVIGATAMFDSPQCPLDLILYAPLGVSLGVVTGTIAWHSAESRR